ncbi:twin-arginine translocase TatA/TatE family subunit [Streptomyces sp. NPDC055722]
MRIAAWQPWSGNPDHRRRLPAALRGQAVPETARGLGKSLRTFKSEVSAMKTDTAQSTVAPRPGIQAHQLDQASRSDPVAQCDTARPAPRRRGAPSSAWPYGLADQRPEERVTQAGDCGRTAPGHEGDWLKALSITWFP